MGYLEIEDPIQITVVLTYPFTGLQGGSANMSDKILITPRKNAEDMRKDIFVVFHELLHILLRKSKKFEKFENNLFLEEAVIEAITNYYFYPDLNNLNLKIEKLTGKSKEICLKALDIINKYEKRWLDFN